MPRISRRRFLKDSALAGIGTAVGSSALFSAPSVLTRPRTLPSTSMGKLRFRPVHVQHGRGPHLLEWAYASDEAWDAFPSDIRATKDGVEISDTGGVRKFGINVRWNVEGFGYTFITADNGGEFYELPPAGRDRRLHLVLELARSRVMRNRRRMTAHRTDGWVPSREAGALLDLSEGYLEDAANASGDEERCGYLAQQSLYFALVAGEMLEVEKAAFDIARAGRRKGFFFGCDARAIYEMHEDLFLERFSELFNYGTVTHVWKGTGVVEDFEPREGEKQYAMRDLAVDKLIGRGITVEGRPLFWFHKWVTPDWIKQMSYDHLLRYVETTTRDVVRHYRGRIWAWELVNELHDWANEVRLNHAQTIELTRLACDVAKDTDPNVQRLVNNCCPYAEYVQLRESSGGPAKFPQRTPLQFTKDLVEAGVDFTIIGQQMYFPYRDLQDIVILLERYRSFGKPLHLSEIGASSGPSNDSVRTGRVGFPKEPYPWRRPWDEELQADWLEGVYTLAYSKPFIAGAHWFDFVDPYSYIQNGGLHRSPKGETKAAFDRLLRLRQQWDGIGQRTK